jgi:hypothetical protein
MHPEDPGERSEVRPEVHGIDVSSSCLDNETCDEVPAVD